MKMNLGENIRTLRKAKGMTQEQLADALNISFQAVSKWENGICLPDLPMLPLLASIFATTTDKLLGFDRREMEEKIRAICDEAYAYRFSDAAKSRAILEAGLAEYPDNDILLNNLLCVIDCEKAPDETIAIASKLIDQSEYPDVRYDALRFLAYAYKAKGDETAAENALEQIPEIYFTKLGEAANVLTGEKRWKAANTQKWISFEDMLDMMKIIAQEYAASGKKQAAREELRRALAIMDALRGDEKIECFAENRAELEKLLEETEKET